MCYSIMSSLNTLFRENFKKCCKEKGYTQQEVADKLGISLDGLKHHLRKNNPYLPSVDLLYKMAKIFDVDISYLIGEINSPKCSMQAISEITGINDRSISLITRNTSQFMPGFCFLINAISKSGHLEEFSSLIEELSFLDSSLINIKGSDHNIFYNSKPAEAKVLKAKILSLFDIILDEIIFDDHLWDQRCIPCTFPKRIFHAPHFPASAEQHSFFLLLFFFLPSDHFLTAFIRTSCLINSTMFLSK